MANKTIELKTKTSEKNPIEIINAIEDDSRRETCFKLIEFFKEATGETPVLWGDSTIGYGKYTYISSKGDCGEWYSFGFAPRKNNIALYIMGYLEEYPEFVSKLGKLKTGKSCIYINKLSDIDLNAFNELIQKIKQNKK